MDMSDQLELCGRMLRLEGTSLSSVHFHMQRVLADTPLRDRRVLDIGCGRGLHSIYMALQGAQVTAIDPEVHGSNPGVTQVLLNRLSQLELQSVRFKPIGLFDLASSEGPFDLIFSWNVINHIWPTRLDASRNHQAYSAYRDVVDRMCTFLSPGGRLLIADCARSNLFAVLTRLGIPHPIPGCRSIEWGTHQQMSTWRSILLKEGLAILRVTWYVPYPLRRLESILNNSLWGYLTTSHFAILAMRR